MREQGEHTQADAAQRYGHDFAGLHSVKFRDPLPVARTVTNDVFFQSRTFHVYFFGYYM
jgi:hypothetical protein